MENIRHLAEVEWRKHRGWGAIAIVELWAWTKTEWYNIPIEKCQNGAQYAKEIITVIRTKGGNAKYYKCI